jgi:hypothetical protein
VRGLASPQPQKIPVGSDSISARSGATVGAGLIWSYRCQRSLAVAPVKRPGLGFVVETQLGDPKARPLGSVLRLPGRAALDDRDGATAAAALHPDLVAEVVRDLLSAEALDRS